MKVILLVLLALPAIAAADRSYSVTAETVTHDCAKEPAVAVNASDGTYTFTGTCSKISVNGGNNKLVIEAVRRLTITGTKNTADVDAADRIGVNGPYNTINYKRGLSGKLPKVGAVGGNNKLNQVK